MKEIRLTIIAKSPLAIGNKKPSSVSEAIDYIPGSVIRGAIASQLIERGGKPKIDDDSDDFNRLFIANNAAIFSNAYPAPYLLPSTAVSSKANPGFKAKGNGVFDTLIDRFCADSYGLPFDPNCPKDGGRVEPFGGFYNLAINKYQSKSVTKRLLTRAGINRRRATSEEAILYSIEVINESTEKSPVVFQSSIFVEDDLAPLLQSFIDRSSISIGGSVSRGLGKIAIETELLDINLDIKKNIDTFNRTLKKRYGKWSIFDNSTEDKKPEFPNRVYFTLNLESEAILRDRWRRTTAISSEMLSQFLGITEDTLIQDLCLEASYSSYNYLSGWNSAWGLMKDIELVTNKSSVYLYSIDPEYEKEYIDKLQKLAIEGVGERTTEGFGRITICHPFHNISREEAV